MRFHHRVVVQRLLSVAVVGAVSVVIPMTTMALQPPKEGGSKEGGGREAGSGSVGVLSGSAGSGTQGGTTGSSTGSTSGSRRWGETEFGPTSPRERRDLDRALGDLHSDPERAIRISETFAVRTNEPTLRAEALSVAAYAAGLQVDRVPPGMDGGPIRRRAEARMEAALASQDVASGPPPANPLPGEPVVAAPRRDRPPLAHNERMYKSLFGGCIRLVTQGPMRWRCLHNFGRLLIDLGNLDEAEALLGPLTDLNEDDLSPGEDSRWMAWVLNALGTAQIGRNRVSNARVAFEKALRIQERFGTNLTDRAVTLANLAGTEAAAGRFRRAQALYETAIDAFGKAGDLQRANLVTTLDSLARICWNLAEYPRALALYERALGLAEAYSHTDRLTLAQNTWGIARVQFSLGNLSRARGLFERARALAESAGDGKARIVLGLILLDSSKLLQASGDARKAKQMAERAVSVLRRALGDTDPRVVLAMASLAASVELQEPARAEQAFTKALLAAEQTYGAEHPAVASVLLDVAHASRRAGRTQAATRYGKRALSIYENSLGASHPDTARTLEFLSWLTPVAAEAVSLGQRAVKAMEASLGPDHPDLAPILSHLGRSQALDGKHSDSVHSVLRAEAIASRHLVDTVRTLPQEEALRYVVARGSARDLLVSLGGERTTGDEVARIWNAILRSRAVVLDELTSRRRFAPERLSPETRMMAITLSEESRRLSSLLVRGPGTGLTSSGYLLALEDARGKRDEAERSLAQSLEPFRQDVERRRLGFTEVAASLPPGAALVGYVRFNQYVWPAPNRALADQPLIAIPSYAAFVVRRGDPRPSLVSLGGAAIIDANLAAWRRQIGAASAAGPGASALEREDLRVASRLRDLVWAPVQARTQGVERVFVVPDGALNLLNWAALPDDQGRYLAESGPTFHYLSNERDLVQPKSNRDPARGILVVGAPAFDDSSGFAMVNARGPVRLASAAPALPVGEPQTRTAGGCGTFDRLRFASLPGTEREARGVADLWRTAGSLNREGGVTVLLGAAAQEAAFKALAPSRSIVHLATHGFFFDGSCGPADPTNRGVGGLVKQANPGPSATAAAGPQAPISGLALAGANHRDSARESEEDGILTAEEISTMDLSRVEWAVLSGCDTGVGEIKASEGVFGMRRAFQTAGVRSLIMSLWPVGDATTEKWMLALYDGHLKQGLPTAEAVRAASRSVLASRRAASESTHPAHWAAFVSAGAWQ